VEVSLTDPAARWSGHAYLDSNEGDEPVDRGFLEWDWSRAGLADGSTAVVGGWTLWFVLSAPAGEDPEARHDIVRIRLMSMREGQWRDQFGEKLPHAVTNLLTCASIRLVAAHAGISDVEIKERKLILTRNGKLVMVQGKFPRLNSPLGHKQLEEALELIRSL
jgi:hypothetical protein